MSKEKLRIGPGTNIIKLASERATKKGKLKGENKILSTGRLIKKKKGGKAKEVNTLISQNGRLVDSASGESARATVYTPEEIDEVKGDMDDVYKQAVYLSAMTKQGNDVIARMVKSRQNLAADTKIAKKICKSTIKSNNKKKKKNKKKGDGSKFSLGSIT